MKTCTNCGVKYSPELKNFYVRKKKDGSLRIAGSMCKKCTVLKQTERNKQYDKAEEKLNPLCIIHEWVECVFGIARGDVCGQCLIAAAIIGAIGIGFKEGV